MPLIWKARIDARGLMEYFGTTWPIFIGATVLFMGFAAFMSGRALAVGWKSVWHLVPASILLGLGDRFVVWALFRAELVTLPGLVLDTLVLGAIAMFAYRVTLARRMVQQYPWLYERVGLVAWRRKSGAPEF